MTGAMRRDIDRQPAWLADFAGRAEAFRALGAGVLSPRPGGRLYACGCGDGVFAAEAASAFAISCGLDWRPIGALDLVLSAGRLSAADRVVAISMSGNVDRTVEAAAAVALMGVPILALVNGDGGRLGRISSDKISLDLADVAPFLCGTTSYTATVAALMALASGAGGASFRDLADLAEAQREAIARTDAAVGQIGVPSGIRFLSAGAERGTCAYAAAKCVELTRIPAWSADLEEFAHSQYWAMPTSDLVVMIATDPALARYATESCAALAELGVSTLVVDTEAALVPDAGIRITLPAIARDLAPLATAIPLQILAAFLARATGLDPDTRAHLKSDTLRFQVSRKLTRRSLIGTGQ